jgi:hypothetical protein
MVQFLVGAGIHLFTTNHVLSHVAHPSTCQRGIEDFFPRGEAALASLKLIPQPSPLLRSGIQQAFLKTCSVLKHRDIVFCVLIA